MPFTPVHAALGGATLGLSVFHNARLTGRVTGISGTFRSALSLNRSSILFVFGLIASPLPLRPLLPSKPDILSATSQPGLAVAGLLVGLGTTIGNGCTSGHAVCGLARLSRRSAVATVTFMATAIVTASLGGSSARYDRLVPRDLSTPLKVILPSVAEVPYIVGALLIAALVPPVIKRARDAVGKELGLRRVLYDALQVALGFSFGAGLIVSGMALPSKTVSFLDIASPGWDPSLLFVFVGALPMAAAGFWPLLRGRAPALEERHSIPMRKDVTKRLVLGAGLFGVGWGLVGLCPGPSLVYLGGFPGSVGIRVFLSALSVGGLVAKRLFK